MVNDFPHKTLEGDTNTLKEKEGHQDRRNRIDKTPILK